MSDRPEGVPEWAVRDEHGWGWNGRDGKWWLYDGTWGEALRCGLADRTGSDPLGGGYARFGGYVLDDADRNLLAAAVLEIEGLRAEVESMVARGGDRARMGCPQCPDSVEEQPVLRCIQCGMGYYEEADR